MAAPQLSLLLLLFAIWAGAAQAQPTLEPLSALDIAYMQQQTATIDELAARQLGRRLQRRESDLSLLQSMLDRRLIKADDSSGLQAMGIVLGNILAAQYDLDWVIYRDSKGRSRALSIGPEAQVLFPSTSISRRVEAGTPVDIRALYQKSVRTIERARARGIKPY